MKKILIAAVILICIIAFLSNVFVSKKNKDIFTSCISIGNALEAPKDIKWDVTMDEKYFDEIKSVGFDAVRIPVRFSDYVEGNNYILNEDFMKKIDYYVDYALDLKLNVILDFHHFVEIMDDPYAYKDCFISIWSQLAERYKKYDDTLIFELLNEPCDNLSSEILNDFIQEGVDTIRRTNKTRTIIVGPTNYNSLYKLEELKLPKDNNLLLTFHYYEPNDVTFQGSINHKGYENLSNITWEGTEKELQYLRDRFKIVKDYADKNNIKVFLGEFGVNEKAPRETRIKWTQAVKDEALLNGFSYGYWEFASEFGIYNRDTNSWDKEILSCFFQV